MSDVGCKVCGAGLKEISLVVCEPCENEGVVAVKRCVEVLIGIKPGLRESVLKGLAKAFSSESGAEYN